MRRLSRLAVAFGLTFLVTTASVHGTAEANTAVNSYIVEYNGHLLSSPKGVVRYGTTFMPVQDLVDILHSLNVNATWSSGNFIVGYPIPIDPRPQTGTSAMIYVQGREFARVPLIDIQTDATQKSWLVPIWYIMRALGTMGYQNHWNGHVWTIAKG